MERALSHPSDAYKLQVFFTLLEYLCTSELSHRHALKHDHWARPNVTRAWMHDPRFDIRHGPKDFIFSKTSRLALGSAMIPV